MQLTNKQEKALKIILNKYENREKFAVIAGYAGSGKSTVIKFIIEALCDTYSINIDTEVAYCAFTGKAAQVLSNKGCPNAVTLHKLLYQARPLPNGKFFFMRKTEIEYRVVVVDECSMAPREMVEQLLRYPNVFVIFAGDPEQLPPINKDQDNHLLERADIFLDEIMRQAADSGIIQLSMLIREGKAIDNFKSNDAIVLPKSELNTGMLTWSDIILTATNKTRKEINTECRKLLGYTKPIEEGEKIICCNNYWSYCAEDGNALTNGSIGKLTNFFDNFQMYPKMFKVPNNKVMTICGTFVSEYGSDFGQLNMDKNCIITGEPALDSRQKYNIGRNKKYTDTIPLEFTYAYAITGHKSQGSQWNKVLVIEENFPFDKKEHKQWLYSCVTRGSDKVVLVR